MNPSYIIYPEKVGTYSWAFRDDIYEHPSGENNIHYVSFNCMDPYKIVTDADMIHIYKHQEDASETKYPYIPTPNTNEEEEESEEEDIFDTDNHLCYVYLFSYKIVKRMTHIDQPIPFEYKFPISGMSLDELGYFVYLGNNRYVYIEHEIYEFEPASEIINYIPERCGDCVPYHYAFDSDYIYLLGYNQKISIKDYPITDTQRFDPYAIGTHPNIQPLNNMTLVDKY